MSIVCQKVFQIDTETKHEAFKGLRIHSTSTDNQHPHSHSLNFINIPEPEVDASGVRHKTVIHERHQVKSHPEPVATKGLAQEAWARFGQSEYGLK